MRVKGLILASLILVGCEPHLYDFYVIQIPPGPGVEAVDAGKAANEMVLFDETVVTSYRLSREGYTLLGKLDFRNSHPTIDFAAHDGAGNALEVIPERYGACGSFEIPGVERQVNGYPAKRYSWMPRWHKQCASDSRGPYPSEQVIKFEVRTAQGRLLAVEEIPFEVKRNGKYLEYDAF